MSGGGSSGTTTTSTELPGFQKDALKFGFGEALDIYNQGAPGYYPGKTWAKVTPETELAWNMATDRATAGSPLVGASQGYVNDVLAGKYLTPGNPYMGEVDNAIWSSVAPKYASQFSGAGRYGSGAQAEATARGYTDALAPYHYGAYESERNLMQDAAKMAPGLAAEDYRDIAALSGVGAERQAEAQKIIDSKMQKYGYESTADLNYLKDYMGLIQGNYGQTQTQPYYTTPWWQSALGAGATAAGIAGSLGLTFG